MDPLKAKAGLLWYQDVSGRALVAFRYVPLLAVLNLAWETVQLPLYAIWSKGTSSEIAFAVFHCTLGDILIGLAALVLALIFERERGLAEWRWKRIASLLALFGTGYTLFSEWMNTTLSRWVYSESMPTFNLGGTEIGLSPLVQWLVVPPMALWMTSRAISRAG